MPVAQNQKGGRALVRNASANATYVIAGNSSVSNVASTGEIVASAVITNLLWSTDGTVTILRGANTICILTGTGAWSLREFGITLPEYPAANLVINFSSANSTAVVELAKTSDGYPEYQ